MNFLKKLFSKEKKSKEQSCALVIVAAGASTRMGQDKTMLSLDGVPVIIRTIRAFDGVEAIKEIVLVTREDNLQTLADLVAQYQIKNVSQIVAGGATREQSCLAGVSAVRSKVKLIAIHDCARPFVTKELAEKCIETAATYMAAVPGIRETDTIRTVNDGYLDETLDRESIVRIQTPQVFDADIIKGALTHAVEKGLNLTDDSAAVALMGIRSRLVNGDRDNIKLTTPEDLYVAEAILKKRESNS